MTDTAVVYDGFLTGFVQRSVDWVQDPFRVVLVSGEYQPDRSHRTRADLGKFELPTGAGYTAGGTRLRARAFEASDPGVLLTASDVSYLGFTGRFRYAVVCQDNGGRSTDLLVSCGDMGDQDVTDADVVLRYSTDGVCRFAPDDDGDAA